MPRDYIDIGCTPANEPCQGVGTPDYDPEKERQESTRFLNLIRKTLGDEPPGARLAIMSNPHDFGTYLSVVCYYQDDNEAATNYAFRCEDEAPTEWDTPADGDQPAGTEPPKAQLDIDQVMEAVEADDGTGFCLACGDQASGCEPDARGYTCDSCGEKRVFGAMEVLLMGV